jgi:hypothetical protein
MTTTEETQPRSPGFFPWAVGLAAFAALLFCEASLARRMSSLERLMIQAAQERQANVSEDDSAPLRRPSRSTAEVRREGDSPDFAADALPGSVLNTIASGVSALQGQIQSLTNVLSPSAATSGSAGVLEYDPTLPRNLNDEAKEEQQGRGWGPEQAVGSPNAVGGGDAREAWASNAPDAGPEWLWVGFERPVEAGRIRIRENHNPGAIAKVTGMVNQQEVVLWEGVAAKRPGPRDFAFPVAPGHVLQSVVVHLDTSRVAGWNEIDAVELIGRDGSRQWAVSANASSFYGQ